MQLENIFMLFWLRFHLMLENFESCFRENPVLQSERSIMVKNLEGRSFLGSTGDPFFGVKPLF